MTRKTLRLLSWNIDMDTSPKTARALALIRHIRAERPDVVCLQEVTEQTHKIISGAICKAPPASPDTSPPPVHYDLHIHPDWPTTLPYFCMMLTRHGALTDVKATAERFEYSQMHRGFVRMDAKLGGVPVAVATSHLESLQLGTTRRKAQFAELLASLRDSVASGSAAVFAGDTNLREAEVPARQVQKAATAKAADGPPAKRRRAEPKFLDAWVEAGMNDSEKFTWDMNHNDNLDGFNEFKPKARYDRCFALAPDEVKLQVDKFRLLGKERLPCEKFVSDHWGLCVDLSVQVAEPKSE